MPRIFQTSSHGLGRRQEDEVLAPSSNHKVASLPKEVQSKIASMGLVRVAGNVYECPSSADFWKVQGGKVIRLATDEVDNGDTLVAAPNDHPAAFLEEILEGLSF